MVRPTAVSSDQIAITTSSFLPWTTSPPPPPPTHTQKKKKKMGASLTGKDLLSQEQIHSSTKELSLLIRGKNRHVKHAHLPQPGCTDAQTGQGFTGLIAVFSCSSLFEKKTDMHSSMLCT